MFHIQAVHAVCLSVPGVRGFFLFLLCGHHPVPNMHPHIPVERFFLLRCHSRIFSIQIRDKRHRISRLLKYRIIWNCLVLRLFRLLRFSRICSILRSLKQILQRIRICDCPRPVHDCSAVAVRILRCLLSVDLGGSGRVRISGESDKRGTLLSVVGIRFVPPFRSLRRQVYPLRGV